MKGKAVEPDQSVKRCDFEMGAVYRGCSSEGERRSLAIRIMAIQR